MGNSIRRRDVTGDAIDVVEWLIDITRGYRNDTWLRYLRMKTYKSVHIDRPIITAETQPIEVTTIPSQCGGRLRRARVLNVWMPMATMKKNEAYSPISLNDPKQRQSSETCENMKRRQCTIP